MSKVIVIDKCSICPNTDHKGLKVNKTTEALKLAEEAAEFARNICLGMNWSTDLPDEALAAIREVLADSKPAPDGRIPKTVFTLDDISKAAEIGRQAGMIDALAEPVKQKPVGVVEPSEEWGVAGVLIAGLPIGTKLYAAPVSAEAIRAEDYIKAYQQGRKDMKEEAAKVCDSRADGALQAAEFAGRNALIAAEEATECAAAIRGLK